MRPEIEDDPDWMYKPILNTDTRTTYDSDGIQENYIEEYEQFEKDN